MTKDFAAKKLVGEWNLIKIPALFLKTYNNIVDKNVGEQWRTQRKNAPPSGMLGHKIFSIYLLSNMKRKN
jgi:hypothetical protein